MITLICATHRPENQTMLVVKKYEELIKDKNEQAQIFSLQNLPDSFLGSNSFENASPELQNQVEEYINQVHKLIVMAPEYNGSYPGLFKAFLDVIPPQIWKGKKVALVGVASGRAGNLRGMDHLTDVFHHLGAEVYSKKIPISRLDSLTINSELADSYTIQEMGKQLEGFLEF